MSRRPTQALRGVSSLNEIQSSVLNTALYSAENMLVCAPTGAGKTNVALLSMLQLVLASVEGGVLQRERIKIVYVAPMKVTAPQPSSAAPFIRRCVHVATVYP